MLITQFQVDEVVTQPLPAEQPELEAQAHQRQDYIRIHIVQGSQAYSFDVTRCDRVYPVIMNWATQQHYTNSVDQIPRENNHREAHIWRHRYERQWRDNGAQECYQDQTEETATGKRHCVTWPEVLQYFRSSSVFTKTLFYVAETEEFLAH